MARTKQTARKTTGGVLIVMKHIYNLTHTQARPPANNSPPNRPGPRRQSTLYVLDSPLRTIMELTRPCDDSPPVV